MQLFKRILLDLPVAEHDNALLRDQEATDQEQPHPFWLRSLSFPPLLPPPLQPLQMRKKGRHINM